MYWVMLTKLDGSSVCINLDRFDFIARSDDDKFTIISSTLSQTEEDFVMVEVLERPDDFIPVMESEKIFQKKI